MTEIWTHIDGYNDFYQVSNLGRVKSKNCILKIKIANNGYAQVGLSKHSKIRWHLIHRLVYSSFVGKTDLQVDHINEIKTDNRLINLQALSSYDNNIKAKRHNKTSIFPGVHLYKNMKWRAQIGIKNKKYHLGYFDNEQDAYKAYLNARP